MKKRVGAFIKSIAWEGATLVVLVTLVWVFMAKGILNDRDLIQPVMWHLMILTGTGTVMLAFCKKLTYKRLVFIILLAGIAMRIGFVLYKPTYTAYHDLGEITTEGYYGHASYILKIFETKALPRENAGQYYHPPFFHILAACTMKVTGRLLQITDEAELFESTKIISCWASCMTLLVSRKILKELGLGKTAAVIALAVCAFLPIHYMLGGWVNNDALVTFLMTWIILYTIRWYKTPTFFHVIMLALGFGFGVFTKISCALFAFYTGAFMLLRFWRSMPRRTAGKKGYTGEAADIKDKEWKKLLCQFLVFACIAMPIGLFFPVRNYLLFGQGLNFVLRPGDNVYCGDHGFIERFVLFPITRLLSPVHLNPFEEYNLNFYLIKSAVVGEFQYHHVEEWPSAVLIVCNLILVLQAVFSVFCVCIFIRASYNGHPEAGRPASLLRQGFRNGKGKRKPGPHAAEMEMLLWGLPGLWLWIYLNHVALNIRLPYGCTMDFRYIVPTALLGAIYLGVYIENCLQHPSVFRRIFAGTCIGAVCCMTGAGMYMFSNMFKF